MTTEEQSLLEAIQKLCAASTVKGERIAKLLIQGGACFAAAAGYTRAQVSGLAGNSFDVAMEQLPTALESVKHEN